MAQFKTGKKTKTNHCLEHKISFNTFHKIEIIQSSICFLISMELN